MKRTAKYWLMFIMLSGQGSVSIAQPAHFNPTKLRDTPYEDAVAAYEKNRMKIVGGKRALIRVYPWQVSLQVASIPEISWSHFCGGSVLNQKWIITAAHCVAARKPGEITISAGSENLDKTTVRAKVTKIVVHPSYRRDTKDADLALLELESPLSFSESLQPIKLASVAETDTQINQGLSANVTGWGATIEDGHTVRDLRYAEVPLVPRAVCNRPLAYDGWVTQNMLCAGVTAGGTDSCQGDSGGPLSVRVNGNPLLLGAVSWGDGCARPNRVGVYTKLANYTDWINANSSPTLSH